MGSPRPSIYARRTSGEQASGKRTSRKRASGGGPKGREPKGRGPKGSGPKGGRPQGGTVERDTRRQGYTAPFPLLASCAPGHEDRRTARGGVSALTNFAGRRTCEVLYIRNAIAQDWG